MQSRRHAARKSRRNTRIRIENLENRCLLAAHVVGDATVYQTIQAAVDAAAPGGIVNVDAGTYAELVRVTKSIAVRGAQAGVDARSNARGAGESILTGYNLGGPISTSFYINSDNVTIDGFVVQGNTSTGTYGAGIVIAPGRSGAHIVNNIVQNNVAGLYLANSSSTNPALIQHNVFQFNNNAGNNGGRGIYTDGEVAGGALTNVVIDGNYFFRNNGSTGTTGYEAAISFEARGARQTNITITNNVMDYNGKALLIWNAQDVTVANNIITNQHDHWSGALRFEGGVHNVVITGNTAYDNTGPAIRIDSKGYAEDSSGFTITGNNFFGNSNFYTNKESVVIAADQYSGPLDATNNWWGSATGPSGSGGGTGDAIVTNGNSVTFSPWSASIIGNIDTAYRGLPALAGFVIQAEDYDHGGEGLGYHDTDSTNGGGSYRPSEGVDIESTTDTGGGYHVAFTRPGEWLDYALDVPAAGLHRLDVRFANAQSTAGTFHVEIDGVQVTGAITAAPTGGWNKWQTLSVNNINLSPGAHTLRLVMDAAGKDGYIANFNWLKLTNTTPTQTPAAPSNLLASASNPTTVNLAWLDNSGNETGFVIQRRTGTGAWEDLVSVGPNVTAYTDASAVPETVYTYRARATGDAGDSAYSNEASVRTPALTTVSYVSDLPFVGIPTNGWGPVERDTSNGSSGAGDGRPITLNGVVYSKGLGVHASSEVTLDLGGNYARFLSDVGVDDEVAFGSVVFQVWADGVLLYQSPVMTGTSATRSVDVDVTGRQQLKLIVTNGGDDIDYDHADWAGARLIAVTNTGPAAPSNLVATAISTTQIDLTWLDNSLDETGFEIQRSTDGVNFTTIDIAPADATTYSDTTALEGTTYTYRVRAFTDTEFSLYSNKGTTSTPVSLPLAPTDLVATAASIQINLTWTDASTNESGFRIERSSDGVNFTEIATVGANVTSYSDAQADAGVTFTYRVRAYNAGGPSDYSPTSSATLPVGLPAPWSKADVGAVGLAGDSTFSAGTYTIKGSGGDIWDKADSFQFAYQAITGNCTIIARVASQQNTHKNAKAGIMIRESLAPNSRHASVVVTPGSGIMAIRRTSTGGSTSSNTKSGLKAPYWVKLVRSGDTFTYYYSADGVKWTKLASNKVAMNSTVYVGLAVCARNNAVLNTSTFDNVSITQP